MGIVWRVWRRIFAPIRRSRFWSIRNDLSTWILGIRSRYLVFGICIYGCVYIIWELAYILYYYVWG